MEKSRRLSRRMMIAGGIIVAMLVAGVTAAVVYAQSNEPVKNRVALGRDIARLAIVVMANQTPITKEDARSILPVLQELRTKDQITEEVAAQLDRKLQNVLSPELKLAISVVRLPEPKPEMIARMQKIAARHHFRNPAKSGPVSKAYAHLIEFFQETAK